VYTKWVKNTRTSDEIARRKIPRVWNIPIAPLKHSLEVLNSYYGWIEGSIVAAGVVVVVVVVVVVIVVVVVVVVVVVGSSGSSSSNILYSFLFLCFTLILIYPGSLYWYFHICYIISNS